MYRIILMFLANFFRLPYMLYKLFHYDKHKDRFSSAERFAFVQKSDRWANKGGRVTVETTGLDNVPSEGGFVMYPNHQGMYDVLTLLQVMPRPISPVSKIETSTVPLLKNVLSILDAEFMDRSDIRQSMSVIMKTAERVKNGDAFVIFPEGTRSRLGNEMLPFKPGAFKAAVMAKAPIIPVALIDCYIPFDRPSIKKVTVQAHILEPICYEEYKDLKTTEIALLVQERIREKIKKVLSAR